MTGGGRRRSPARPRQAQPRPATHHQVRPVSASVAARARPRFGGAGQLRDDLVADGLGGRRITRRRGLSARASSWTPNCRPFSPRTSSGRRARPRRSAVACDNDSIAPASSRCSAASAFSSRSDDAVSYCSSNCAEGRSGSAQRRRPAVATGAQRGLGGRHRGGGSIELPALHGLTHGKRRGPSIAVGDERVVSLAGRRPQLEVPDVAGRGDPCAEQLGRCLGVPQLGSPGRAGAANPRRRSSAAAPHRRDTPRRRPPSPSARRPSRRRPISSTSASTTKYDVSYP